MEGNIKPSNRWTVDILFTLFMQAILIGFAEGIHKNSEFYLNSRNRIIWAIVVCIYKCLYFNANFRGQAGLELK